MNILSQPDALSLSGNIKDILISSSEVVRFQLYKGDVLLLDNQYSPDAEGYISISIRDIIHSNLYFTLGSGNYYAQTDLAADFRAVISDTEITFRAVKCGVSNLHTSAAAFLAGNFLTWQPQLMEVRYAQPQWLTYYNSASEVVSIILKSYLVGGGTLTTVLAAVAVGECVTVNTQFAHIWGLVEGDKLGYYDVYIQDSAGNTISYVQRYVMTENFPEDKFFLFENTLGGIDSVVFTGENILSPSVTYENAQYDEVLEMSSVDAQRLYTQDTGYKSAREILWLKDFWGSKRIYIVVDGTLRSIVLAEGSISASNMEDLNAFSFSYKLSDDRGYLNLPRLQDIATPLEIATPEQLFFLAPRLSEFLEAELQDFLLLPVQSPYTETWHKLTIGAIKSYIQIYALEAIQPSAHVHSNKAVLDQLVAEHLNILQLLEIDGNGYLKVKENVNLTVGGMAISKRGFRTSNYIGGLTGTGAIIDGDGNAEMESLTLRTFLEVPELRFNRVDIKVGDKWRAPGGGIIERVAEDPDADTGTCWLKLEEGEIGAVAVGDICMGIFHNIDISANATADYDDGRGNREFSGFCTVYFRITEVVDYTDATGVVWHHKQFRYAIRPTSGNWVKQFHPMKFMNFVVYGSFTNTERQTSVYETRTYTRMLRGQNEWEISPAHIAMQYGDMSNLSSIVGDSPNDYSLYIGKIFTTGSIMQVKKDGTPILVANDRGEWVDGMVADYYDRFSYNGGLWLCVAEDGTNTTPSEGDSAWLLQVSAGTSIVAGSRWKSSEVPYPVNSMLSFADKIVISNKQTSQPPIPLLTDSEGNYILTSDGYYILASDEMNEDWYLLLDNTDLVNGEDGASIEVRYSADKVNWHSTFTEGDLYMQQRVGDGSWTDAIRIVGEAGADGMAAEYTTFEFAVNDSLTEPPTSGWQDAPPSVGTGQHLWMRTGVVIPPATAPDVWTAVRISGEKGETGAGYKQRGDWTADKMPAAAMDVFSMGGALWVATVATSNPPLFTVLDSEGNRVLNSDGGYILTGEVNNDEYNKLIESGKDGADGKDFEWIYTTNSTGNTPSTPTGKQEDDYVPSGWTDNPQGVTEDIPFEFASVRTKKDGIWGGFSTPALWAKYGKDGIDGLQGLQGERGEQGIQGPAGANGQTTYFHIKYANDATGSGMNETGGDYLGTYVDFTPEDSTDPTKYTWVLTRGAQGADGADGIPGTNGADGKTSYLHIAYANSADGSVDFSVSDSTGKAYIGQYTDFTLADSTDPTKYSWTKIQGDSITAHGSWRTGLTVPKLGVVTMGGKAFIAKVATSNPPMYTLLDSNGNRLLTSDGRYVLTGEMNTAEYDLLVESGEKGEKGDKGETGAKGEAGTAGIPGISGCILRYAQWAEGIQWRNDEALTSGTRYLDCALIPSAASPTGWVAYKCLSTHTSSEANKPTASGGAGLWEEFGLMIPALFASVILGKNAHIDLLQGNDILVKDSSGLVVAGFSGAGDGVRMWVGADYSDSVSAPFRVLHDGSFYSTKGKIANFIIHENYLGIENGTSGITSGMWLSDSMVGFNDPTSGQMRQAILGAWSNLGTPILARLIDEVQDYLTRYGLVIGIKGSRTENVAIQLNGGHINSLAVKTVNISSSQVLNRNVTSVVCLNTSEISVTLPTMYHYDDGHVVKIKNLNGGPVKVKPGSNYDASGTLRTSYISYDRGSVGTAAAPANQDNAGEAAEYIYHATVTSGSYAGCWVQYKHPRDW